MSDFMFLFRSTAEQQHEAMGTPEAVQQSLQTWLAWIRELEANGHLKDPGQPLDRTGKMVRGKTVTDGPYVEARTWCWAFSSSRRATWTRPWSWRPAAPSPSAAARWRFAP